MDEREYDEKLALLKCAASSRMRVWRVGSGDQAEERWLDGNNIHGELCALECDLKEPLPAASSRSNPSFTLLSTVGDPGLRFMEGSGKVYTPLHMTNKDMASLMRICRFTKHAVRIFGSRHPGLSPAHVEHDEATGKPLAISLAFRLPPNTHAINCALRIRLADRAAVCFLAIHQEVQAEELRDRFRRSAGLLVRRPEHALMLLAAGRADLWEEVLNGLWVEVNDLQTATGMTRPGWWSHVSPDRARRLTQPDGLLEELHSTNTLLCYYSTVYGFAAKFLALCAELVDLVEACRIEAGMAPSEKQVQLRLKEELQAVTYRCQMHSEKQSELMERLRGQINVSFALVTQRDSKINLAIAEDSNRVANLAARDSQTMKTITVLTLVFLPCTLVASVWSAGIFHLDDYLNWRVYLAVSVSLTVSVLIAWLGYMRMYTERRGAPGPFHIAGIGYVREGVIIKKTE